MTSEIRISKSRESRFTLAIRLASEGGFALYKKYGDRPQLDLNI